MQYPRISCPARIKAAHAAEPGGNPRGFRVARAKATTQSLFRRLVLGWIEADFRVQGRIF